MRPVGGEFNRPAGGRGGRPAAATLPEPCESYALGWMFWFTRNVLSGSYLALI